MGRIKFCKDCAHYFSYRDGTGGYCQLRKRRVSPYGTCGKWARRGYPSMIGWVMKSKYR